MQMSKTVQKLYRVFFACLCLLGAVSPTAEAFAVEDFSVHMSIMSLHSPRAPYIVSDHVIISYRPPAQEQRPRYVAAAFQHEQFQKLHTFSINQHNVYVLALPVPRDIDSLVYRLRIDGIWIPDPLAEDSVADIAGRRLSRIQIPEAPESMYRIPAVSSDGRLRLQYRGAPGMNVTVGGTFNHWDPFAQRLREISPGTYEIELRVAPDQQHYYVFYVNGRRTLDPGNPEVAYSRQDQRVSTILSAEQKN